MITNRDLDRQLGPWFEARATSAPPDGLLERSLDAVGGTRQRPTWLVPDHWRSADGRVRPTSNSARVGLVLVALFVVAAAAATVGAWFTHPSNVVVPPAPTPSSSIIASPSPSSDAPTPSPSVQPTPGPAQIVGGGMLLVRDVPRDANGTPIDTVHDFGTGSYDVSLVDPQTGMGTSLGTVPYDWRTGYQPELRWAADGRHAMITDGRGKLWTLDSPTSAADKVVFACCERPGVVGWVFSPSGDRMAGLAQSEETVPGQPGVTSVPVAIVISNVDGTGLRTLNLPDGADTGAAGTTVTWAPDESAIAIAGCRPCNYADPGKKPTNPTHSHLFIVPLDGSPVRELLDETQEGMWNPSWSSDGASIVFGRNDCAAGETQPYCGGGRLSVASVRVADGQQTILAPTPGIFFGPWLSPDGRRVAYSVEQPGVYVLDAAGGGPTKLADGFDPRWSPDGQWLLYSDADGQLWVISADDGQPRLIGAYGAADW